MHVDLFSALLGELQDKIIKATLQSIAYQSRDVVDTMKKDTKVNIPVLKVDGGAANNDYLMQFQADILNTPVQKAPDLETTALGAAFLAGLAVGYWKNIDEIKDKYANGKKFMPKMSDGERKKLYSNWKLAVKATQMFKPNKN